MSKERSAASSWLSASRRGASSAAMTPIGTLTNRTHSQPRYSVNTPPSSTPAAPPDPATAPQTPSARLRSAPSEKVLVTIDSAAGETSAAPRPGRARARSAAVQPRLRLREAAEQRREREDDEADHEELAAAQEVGQAAAEQQEAAEGERVGVDHPGEVVLGEVQRAPDGGQRDVDDGGVEDDDELRHRQERQGEVLRTGGI